MRKIITISREFGAGGGEIGRAVASELGYEYYDKAIILRAAKEANIDVESGYLWDESVPVNFGFAQSLFDFYNKPLNEKLFAAQRDAIKKVGEKGKCVIVGRNANVILKEFDYSLHVFIAASQYFRLKNLKQQMPEYSESKILEEMKSVDKARRRYCTYYTNTEFGNADYYDLTLKSSSLGIDTCVDIICKIAEEN